MSKRVAVFSSSWNDEYLYGYLKGVWKTAQKHNIDVYVFNTYGDAELYEDFNRCEYNIYKLPNLKDFDGVLIISTNVGSIPWLEDLQRRIMQTKIPSISIEQDIEGLKYMGTDNYAAMRDMVEHLVLEHGCKVINYVGGPSDNSENILRKKAFLDVLKEHDIACEEKRIRDYSFRHEDGEQAYWDFKQMGLERPDAVVCANDNMAIGYWVAAMSDGAEAPRDFRITGFDNTAATMLLSQRIASIDRAEKVQGSKSMEQLIGMMGGKEYPKYVHIPHKLINTESCGCPNSDSIQEHNFWRKIYEKERRRSEFDYGINHFRLELLANQNKSVFFEVLLRNMMSFGIMSFCFCMDEAFEEFVCKEKSGYSDKVEVYGMMNGNILESRTIDTLDLIPEEYKAESDKAHIWLFTPNHCGGKKQGYSVVMDNLEIIKERRLYNLITIMSTGLEGMRQNIQLLKMNEELNRLYCMDQMTDLYNRFALEEKGDKLFKRNIEQNKLSAIIFVDMDSLKMVNDIFGHAIGDMCLKVIADSIREALLDKSWFGVRYGGDEFLALGTVEDEASIVGMISKIHNNIKSDARNENFSFELTASIGYVLIAPEEYKGLEYHIKVADADMYKIKKSRAANKKCFNA